MDRGIQSCGRRGACGNDSGVKLLREEPLGLQLCLVMMWKLKENSGTLPQSKVTATGSMFCLGAHYRSFSNCSHSRSVKLMDSQHKCVTDVHGLNVVACHLIPTQCAWHSKRAEVIHFLLEHRSASLMMWRGIYTS